MILNEDAFDYIQSRCPDYTYFGAHYGDGADFGVWVDFDNLEDDAGYEDGILRVGDLSEIDSDWLGYVLVTNDHGNTSLYVKSARKLREVWAVV